MRVTLHARCMPLHSCALVLTVFCTLPTAGKDKPKPDPGAKARLQKMFATATGVRRQPRLGCDDTTALSLTHWPSPCLQCAGQLPQHPAVQCPVYVAS